MIDWLIHKHDVILKFSECVASFPWLIQTFGFRAFVLHASSGEYPIYCKICPFPQKSAHTFGLYSASKDNTNIGWYTHYHSFALLRSRVKKGKFSKSLWRTFNGLCPKSIITRYNFSPIRWFEMHSRWKTWLSRISGIT